MGGNSCLSGVPGLCDHIYLPLQSDNSMKKIALGIECRLDNNKKLILAIPPDVSPKKLHKWNTLHRAWVVQQLMRSKVKSITI